MDDNNDTTLETHKTKEILTLLSGSAGILIAFFWLTGRAFAAGYFNAMGIPAYQITFSVWEYAETSWLYILTSSIMLIFVLIIIVGITSFISLLIDIFANYLRTRKGKIKKRKQTLFTKTGDFFLAWLENSLVPISKLNNLVLFMFVLLIAVAYMVSFTKTQGEKNGYNNVNGEGFQINFTTNISLNLNASAKVTKKSGIYSYRGYRLLTYNNGKYYFFDEIDPDTCKPKGIFIVNEDNLLEVSLSPMPPLDNACPLLDAADLLW